MLGDNGRSERMKGRDPNEGEADNCAEGAAHENVGE
jgi:hypothetical protein